MVLAAVLPFGSLQAVVTAASTSGTGIEAGASLGILINVPLNPLGTTSTSSGSPYSLPGSALAVNADISALGVIDAVAAQGVATTSMVSTVDGSGGSRSATSTTTLTGPAGGPFTATIADLPGIIVNPPPLITLSATVISSTANVSGDYGSLTGVGSSTLANLGLSISGGTTLDLGSLISGLGLVDGVDVDLATGQVFRPNVVILGVNLAPSLAGVTITLNKQTPTVNGAGESALTVTALSIEADAITVGAISALDIDVNLASSTAGLTALPVPEPAAALLGGVAALGLVGRRRRSCC